MEYQGIPSSYEQWKHCITHDCGIPLNSEFVLSRINTLENRKTEYAKQFIRLYGEAHYTNVVQWFKQAKGELT